VSDHRPTKTGGEIVDQALASIEVRASQIDAQLDRFVSETMASLRRTCVYFSADGASKFLEGVAHACLNEAMALKVRQEKEDAPE